MLTGVHFLLSYQCTYECDHCFLYCSPRAEGTFTLAQLKTVFTEIEKIPSIEWVYFEGGEPFLFYPLMLEGLRLARNLGLKTGIVSNCYWASSVDDARLWLEPLIGIGVDDLSFSDDAYHSDNVDASRAKHAVAAAKELGLPVDTICIEGPVAPVDPAHTPGKGEPVTGGNVRFRGRAVEKLSGSAPLHPAGEFTTCPYEELDHPSRVHVDAHGHVHICQGISMGNMWETPLSQLVTNYRSGDHPICGPLLKGGPFHLAQRYGIAHGDAYADACHLCFNTRRALLDRFPEQLAPKLVYGFE